MKSIFCQNAVVTTSTMAHGPYEEKKQVCDEKPEMTDSTYDKRNESDERTSVMEKGVKVSTSREGNT